MYPRATLAATVLGSSLAFIDGSVVNVALPALARDLKVDPANLSWAINAYLLPLGALILLGGRVPRRSLRPAPVLSNRNSNVYFCLGDVCRGAIAAVASGRPRAARIGRG